MAPSRIVLVSPALQEANNGNWHTARRWARFLSASHQVVLLPEWPGLDRAAADADALVALHARRSAPSVHAWGTKHPDRPLILILTGTDLYRDITHDTAAQQSLAIASHLVVLQDAGLQALAPALRSKAHVIYQSARALRPAVKPLNRFTAIMVGHLRDEKDPLTYLKAVACLAQDTDGGARLSFDHIGQALQPELAQAARAAQASVRAYRWLGNLPQADTRQRIKRAHVLVNSSLMEGGAQVILEAVQAGTPVLATRISGNVGMLGEDYAGYFAMGDHAALAEQLRRCATEPAFLALLAQQCSLRAPLFAPREEKRLVLNLLDDALGAHHAPRSARPP